MHSTEMGLDYVSIFTLLTLYNFHYLGEDYGKAWLGEKYQRSRSNVE